MHARLHARWLNDFWTLRTLGSPPVPRTRESLDLLYQQAVVERASDFVFFTVYERNSLQPIGYSTPVRGERQRCNGCHSICSGPSGTDLNPSPAAPGPERRVPAAQCGTPRKSRT